VLRPREIAAFCQSLSQIAKTFPTSRATISRILKEEAQSGVPKEVLPAPFQVQENKPPETAA
jgi:hypothetical protein